MKTFAKIVVVDGQQVLFYAEPDHDTDPDKDDVDYWRLNQLTFANGVMANIAGMGMSEENVLKVITEADEDSARKIIKAVAGLMSTDEMLTDV